ncbi:hypothetical protein QBC35DRAFT_508164 [Podospora australis]|uniref:GRF-like zinc ribbon domain-containing protein n=1 Tax=Podospora australis TaxID=1536484 RepID=A0AAN7AEW5_9PEZI|nr:hypothetical protein QBC35DRAFT_508164 [Podospora australis]
MVRNDSPNRNAGRPYYICCSCPDGKFLVFADYEGNQPWNPRCHCGESSKQQSTGGWYRRTQTRPGTQYYVCRLGTCDYWYTRW